MKKLWKWVVLRIRLIGADMMWDFMGGCCFGLFPPSFYYIHSKEEVDRITKETLKKLEDYLASYRAMIESEIG